MPASSSSTLALAARLRALGDDRLAELITVRGVRDTGIRDFFDLADALLDAASIQQALTRLDRATLAALAVLGEAELDEAGLDNTPVDAAGRTVNQVAARLAGLRSRAGGTSAGSATSAAPVAGGPEAALDELQSSLRWAEDLALAYFDTPHWHTFQPVARQLREWPSLGLPDLAQLASEPAPAAPAAKPASTAAVDSHAAENAFATTTVVAGLIAELRKHPARELAKGGVALPDTKRLAAALAVEPDAVPAYVAMASGSDLIALDGGAWLPTAAGEEWLLLPSGERWARLAEAWLHDVPANIRRLLAEPSTAFWGSRLADHLAWLYPAGAQWMRERSLVYTRDAELLGITAGQLPSTAGSALLAEGVGAATAAMAGRLPAEIDRVYVQHDLSIVSPGPLAAQLDARLLRIADVENRALATTYRITESSLDRAFSAGESAESVRDFLSGISLTGIPQPLDYLISTASARHGLLRVGELDPEAADPDSAEWGARSYLRSEDASLLGTVLVDQVLRPLDLRKIGPHRAVSRFERDVLYWALADARYPAAAEDALGQVLALERRRVARNRPAPAEPASASIIRKLRFAGAPSTADTGQAWLERQLDAAAKGKLAVTVTVRMPDGSLLDLDLEPTSIAGGRLRARDRSSDLERTLPLSSITGVTPASQQ